MKGFLSVTLLLVSVLLVSGLAEAEVVSDRDLRLGFNLPLSGEWAFLGNGIRNAALLAEEDLKSKGMNVELRFEDNRGDMTAAAAAGLKLLDIEKSDAVVSIISGVGKILKPMATKRGVINIGICSDTDVADGKFSFVNYLTAEQGVRRYLDYFLKKFGREKSIGIFTLNEAGFLNIVNELKASADKDLSIAFVETFDKGATDFRSQLLRNSKQKPDALLILGLSPEIEILIRQARVFGIKTPVTSIEGFGLAKDKTPFEGAWFVDSAIPDSRFRDRFFKAYGYEVTPGAGHAYDTVTLLAAAYYSEKDKAKFVERFRALANFNGVIGNISVRKDGVIWSDASVKIIKNGRAQLMSDVGH